MKSRTNRVDPRWVLLVTILAGCSRASSAERGQTMNAVTSAEEARSVNLERNKKIVRRIFDEGFNHGDLAVLDELVSQDFPGPHGKRGPASFANVYKTLHDACPDLRYELQELSAEGDKVAVRWHWTGTHTGPYRAFLAAGDAVVPASNKAVDNAGIGFFEIKDGKVVKATLQTDQLGFLQNIGLVADTPTLFQKPAAAMR
jgi:steroid delta-isomerase-like uncharacterized protein